MTLVENVRKGAVTELDERAKPFIGQIDVRLYGAHAKRRFAEG